VIASEALRMRTGKLKRRMPVEVRTRASAVILAWPEM